MAARESMGTNIDPGIVARIAAGIKYAITGVGPDNFFGPQQPLTPLAQDKTEGRMWDYPVGFNLRITPRQGEGMSWYQLRGMADGYDLMRLAIETRKDQLESYEWQIVPKDENEDADKYADQIAEVTDFLKSPDQEHTWAEWMRMLIEDLLVIDAVCIYPRMNKGGKLYGLELVDGATINRLLDDSGRTPLPPSPAYQQIIKGIPVADYTRDDLSYWCRNPRTWRVYGFSPVEQVIMTVNIALRRQMSQLDFYTAGNIPEALAQVPDTWNMKQVAEFQAYWDSVMEGNTAERRKMRFIPALKGIEFPKKELLKDEFDEWLARIICYAFSLPPTAFIKQNNRATAENAAETAKEEGTMPTLRWLEAKMTALINKYIGADKLKFSWKMAKVVDPTIQQTIHSGYVNSQIMTPDEVREELGRDPLTPEERAGAFPIFTTQTTPQAAQQAQDSAKATSDAQAAAAKNPPVPGQKPGAVVPPKVKLKEAA